MAYREIFSQFFMNYFASTESWNSIPRSITFGMVVYSSKQQTKAFAGEKPVGDHVLVTALANPTRYYFVGLPYHHYLFCGMLVAAFHILFNFIVVKINRLLEERHYPHTVSCPVHSTTFLAQMQSHNSEGN